MLTTEWNWDTAKEVWQEEAREEGREEGRGEILKLFEQGLSVEEIKERLRK
jgi:predicted transposase YdaD